MSTAERRDVPITIQIAPTMEPMPVAQDKTPWLWIGAAALGLLLVLK